MSIRNIHLINAELKRLIETLKLGDLKLVELENAIRLMRGSIDGKPAGY